jgi:hypothetical protein
MMMMDCSIHLDTALFFMAHYIGLVPASVNKFIDFFLKFTEIDGIKLVLILKPVNFGIQNRNF